MAIDIKPDLDTAVKFLQSWCSEPVLSAKMVDESTGQKGDFETQQFRHPCDWDAVRKWIADRQRPGNWGNIYFAVNPPKGAVDKKTGRGDLGYMVACHCDIDVRPGEDQLLGTERILKLLTHCKNPPSVIISSGGGAQPIWRLAAPVPIDGNIAIAENLKLYNVAIERDLGGDHCHDLTRILRVPGTVNVPDAEKVKRGRVPRLATLYKCDPSISYSLDQFPKAEPETPPVEEGFVAKKASEYGAVDPKDGRLVKLSKEWLDLGLLGDIKNEYLDHGGKTDRSRMALAFATACLRAQVDKDTLAAIIMDKGWKIGECVRDKGGETRRQLKRLVERAQKFVDDDLSKPAVLGKDTWMRNAGVFLLRRFPDGLIYWQGDWYYYSNGVWKVIEEGTVRAEARNFMNDCKLAVRPKKKSQADKDADAKAAEMGAGEGKAQEPGAQGSDDEDAIIFKPFNPDNGDENEMYGALRSQCHVDRERFDMPCWYPGGEDRLDPREFINCQNGLLHVPSRTLFPHTNEFLTTSQSEFSFIEGAECPVWLATLRSYWPEDDAGEPTLLQEMFGYCITARTDLQKVFASVGPGRSGKGTLGKVLTKLVGKKNTANPLLKSLCGEFGAMQLLRKSLAVIGEVSFGRNDDRTGVTNFIKTVSGEDDVSINRKNKDFWEGKLLTRFWFECNKIPDFDDSGKALAMRLIPLTMTITWSGREDKTLLKKLTAELPGILNWALVGYGRLKDNDGVFSLPKRSEETRELFSRMASPMVAFVEDACDLDPAAWVGEDELFEAWSAFCEKNGAGHGNKSTFINNLVSTDPARLTRCQKSEGSRGDQRRIRAVLGIKLRPETMAAAQKQQRREQADRGTDEAGKIPF